MGQGLWSGTAARLADGQQRALLTATALPAAVDSKLFSTKCPKQVLAPYRTTLRPGKVQQMLSKARPEHSRNPADVPERWDSTCLVDLDSAAVCDLLDQSQQASFEVTEAGVLVGGADVGDLDRTA